jgi:hypothetical protein
MNLDDINTEFYEEPELCSEVYIPLADRVDTLEMENAALRDRIDEIENRIALYNIKAAHRI